MGIFKFADTINASFVLVCRNIICYIYIPPGVVIIDAVPGVLGGGFVRSSIHYIARDILATAEGGEEIGEVVTDAFVGA